MRILVTGSNGFIGSFLVEALLEKGHEVFCLVRRTSNLRWLRGLDVEYIYGELRDEESLERAVAGKDYVYHTAAALSGLNQRYFDEINYYGTKNLLEACAKNNRPLRRFVYVSTIAAVGPSPDTTPLKEDAEPHPVSFYGLSKLKGEIVTREYRDKIPVSIVRLPAIYGPRDGSLSGFFKAINRGFRIEVGRGKIFNFSFVKDVIDGIILVGESERAAGETYYIGSEKGYSWDEVTETVAEELGVKTVTIRIPDVVAKGIGAFVTVIAKVRGRSIILDYQKMKEFLQKYWLCDISKAREQLGYRQKYSLRDGIRETIGWYREAGWL